MLDRLVAATFDRHPADRYQAEIARTVQRVVADRLHDLAADADLPQARAVAVQKLRQLEQRATAASVAGTAADRAHFALLAEDLKRFRERNYDPAARARSLTPPPGSPIGDEEP